MVEHWGEPSGVLGCLTVELHIGVSSCFFIILNFEQKELCVSLYSAMALFLIEVVASGFFRAFKNLSLFFVFVIIEAA